jgi:hypothetical protein
MEPETEPPAVFELMREIRARARARIQPLVHPEGGGAPQQQATSFELSRVRHSAIELRQAMRRANEMPPQPPTLRGRLGGIMVRVMRRMLFWQTEQNRRFQTAAVNAFDEQLRALEALWTHVQGLAALAAESGHELDGERARMRQELERLETLLRESNIPRADLAAECRAALGRIEQASQRRTSTPGVRQ